MKRRPLVKHTPTSPSLSFLFLVMLDQAGQRVTLAALARILPLDIRRRETNSTTQRLCGGQFVSNWVNHLLVSNLRPQEESVCRSEQGKTQRLAAHWESV